MFFFRHRAHGLVSSHLTLDAAQALHAWETRWARFGCLDRSNLRRAAWRHPCRFKRSLEKGVIVSPIPGKSTGRHSHFLENAFPQTPHEKGLSCVSVAVSAVGWRGWGKRPYESGRDARDGLRARIADDSGCIGRRGGMHHQRAARHPQRSFRGAAGGPL